VHVEPTEEDVLKPFELATHRDREGDWARGRRCVGFTSPLTSLSASRRDKFCAFALIGLRFRVAVGSSFLFGNEVWDSAELETTL
jgi:hypothetical protein